MADFTLPGEAGYEALTLELAKRWGADVIRDSDGTELSDSMLNAGFDIYSTLCIIRGHNAWAKAHPGFLQQTFLMTPPVVATDTALDIPLMESYYDQQFEINETAESLALWQVFDRTANVELLPGDWHYEKGRVTLRKVTPFHRYTVNFLAWQVWEEISMYNHVTNGWEGEHLVPLDPRHPEVQAYLMQWLDDWCRTHPATDVVRFTSLFYNFVWIWSASAENRNWFTDWASYDFTVSPLAIRQFEAKYGYRITSEDFINQGKLQATHMPPTRAKRDWMDFTQHFVWELGSRMVAKVHDYGKKAYVFYDDSWVGLEPYGPYFPDYRFDGLIKCVFSGYEARLCAGARGTETRELRLHPYLFPTGLGGAPTFAPGGDPTADARRYWMQVRRALLRAPVDRLGLGGYLHLTEGYPDFVDYIEQVTREFAELKALHRQDRPLSLPVRVAVLHTWGKLRSWTLSGHFHETDRHMLIHILEALSGLPVEVDFIDFTEVKGDLSRYTALLNAGRAGDGWSGGDAWADPEVVSALTQWVWEGGTFIGVQDPSAAPGFDTFFRMAHVLGVDMDTGARTCHGKWPVAPETGTGFPFGEACSRPEVYLLSPDTQVYAVAQGAPTFTRHPFGAGQGYYLSSFQYGPEASAALLRLLTEGRGEGKCLSDNPQVDIACFAGAGKVVLANASGQPQEVTYDAGEGKVTRRILPYALEVVSG